MQKKPFQNGKSEVTTRDLVMDCALPAMPGESRKAMLKRAAENAGLSYARMVAFFYNKGNPPPEAQEKLRQAAIERRRIRQAWSDIERDKRLAELIDTQKRLDREIETLRRTVRGGSGIGDHSIGTAHPARRATDR